MCFLTRFSKCEPYVYCKHMQKEKKNMLLILFCISCLVIVLLSPYDSNKNDCVFIVAGTTVFFVLIILSNYLNP